MTPLDKLLEECVLMDADSEATRTMEKAVAAIMKLRDALERIRDCDFVISLPDRMDAVRKIAREALQFESCTQNNKVSATVIPEAQSFYYDAKSNVLAYCETGRIHWGDVSLRKVNENDVDADDASCSLEYFKKHYKKVAFMQAKEARND
jgi:hypothetical protein